MKILYETIPGEDYNKIKAIKAIRFYTGADLLGLKAAKEAIEEAVATGEVIIPDGNGSITELRKNLTEAGRFTAESTLKELYASIEHAINLSVSTRQYHITTALIELLPEEATAK